MIQKRRITGIKLTLLVAFAMVFTVTLTGAGSIAHGAESKPDMSLGSSYLIKGDTFYYGTFDNEPVDFIAFNNDGYIYSRHILDKTVFNNYSVGQDSTKKNYWIGSVAENWCENTFYANGFSSIEKTAIRPITADDPSFSHSDTYYYFPQHLENDHAYFLSLGDISSMSIEERKAFMRDGSQPCYWTRTGLAFTGQPYGGIMTSFIAQDTSSIPSWMGIESYTYTNYNLGCAYYFGARPTITLDKDMIFMITKAQGGKTSGDVGEKALVPVQNTDTGQWKLTIRDDSATFNANILDKTDSSFTIDYNNAYTGDNGFVSVVITDEAGKAVYYGRVAQNSAEGRQKVDIPSDLAKGKYSINVFTEQVNADCRTDYARVGLAFDYEKKDQETSSPAETTIHETTHSAAPLTSTRPGISDQDKRDSTENNSSSNTGESLAVIWMGLLFILAISIGALCIVRRRIER